MCVYVYNTYVYIIPVQCTCCSPKSEYAAMHDKGGCRNSVILGVVYVEFHNFIVYDKFV